MGVKKYVFEAPEVSNILFHHLWLSKLISTPDKPVGVTTEWKLDKDPKKNTITLELDLPMAWEAVAEAQRKRTLNG